MEIAKTPLGACRPQAAHPFFGTLPGVAGSPCEDGERSCGSRAASWDWRLVNADGTSELCALTPAQPEGRHGSA
eukprot:6334633-Amphidinium_carterae.1